MRFKNSAYSTGFYAVQTKWGRKNTEIILTIQMKNRFISMDLVM